MAILAKVVVATGKIQPLSKVEVKSKASGIVKKLYVDYGDKVKQGQILAELDKIQLEASVRARKLTIKPHKPRAIPQSRRWNEAKSTPKVPMFHSSS